MTYSVLWSNAALDRAAQLFDFIAEDSPIAAKRAIEDLFDRVRSLEEFPQLGRRLSEDIDPSVRKLVVGAYVVVYQADDAARTVNIVAVRHAREQALREEGT